MKARPDIGTSEREILKQYLKYTPGKLSNFAKNSFQSLKIKRDWFLEKPAVSSAVCALRYMRLYIYKHIWLIKIMHNFKCLIHILVLMPFAFFLSDRCENANSLTAMNTNLLFKIFDGNMRKPSHAGTHR